jgi:hypothetical protein
MPGEAMNAEAILQRLLLVLPLAAREEGTRIEELADALELSPPTLLRDLEVLESRSYYLPAGLGDQLQLSLTREHLRARPRKPGTTSPPRPRSKRPRRGFSRTAGSMMEVRTTSARRSRRWWTTPPGSPGGSGNGGGRTPKRWTEAESGCATGSWTRSGSSGIPFPMEPRRGSWSRIGCGSGWWKQ